MSDYINNYKVVLCNWGDCGKTQPQNNTNAPNSPSPDTPSFASIDKDKLNIGTNNTLGNFQTGIAVGFRNAVSLDKGFVIGTDNRVGAQRGIAIGRFSISGDGKTAASQTIAIGVGNVVNEGAIATGDQSIAIGGNTVAAGNCSIAIGGDDLDKISKTNLRKEYSDFTGVDLLIEGQYANTQAKGEASVAIGFKSIASGAMAYALGVGVSASGEFATGIGVGAEAAQIGSVAIGAGSKSMPVEAVSRVVFGSAQRAFAGGSPTAGFSIGRPSKERQIQNVAAGRLSAVSTDAVNGSQVYQLMEYVKELETRIRTLEQKG